MNRRTLGALAAAAVLTCITGTAFAQAWPNKPITVVVPFLAGGGTDVVTRLVMGKLSTALGQSIIVENKPGAGGSIGLGEVVRARPDGYTLVAGGSNNAYMPLLFDIPFDPSVDLVSVATLATVPIVLVAAPSLPVHTVGELIALGKRQSSSPMNFASPGISTPQHLSGVYLGSVAGIPLTHVPYKGTSQAITDLMGGHVALGMLGLPSVLPHAKNGKLTIIGVASRKRSALAPEIPTIEEGGLKGFEASYWWDISAPKGTPEAIVERLHNEIVKILRNPEMRETMAKGGFEAMIMTREEAARALKLETAKWTKVIRENNIRAGQ